MMIAWKHATKAASHSRPGSRSPTFASSMIFWATCVSAQGNWPVRMLEGHQGHLESDALALQVVPDRHG